MTGEQPCQPVRLLALGQADEGLLQVDRSSVVLVAEMVDVDALVEEGYLRTLPRDPITRSHETWVPEFEEIDPDMEPAETDLPDGSVDLVVTDPPFFDNVHYSELADFFPDMENMVLVRHEHDQCPTPGEDQHG